MARHEADREDLMREATALVLRAELHVDGFPDPVTVGEKRTGGVSVYIGADPVYQFDEAGRLRRAYKGGLLYRTQGDTLAELTRERAEASTVLQRRDLQAAETQQFMESMSLQLGNLVRSLSERRFRLEQQIPADIDVVTRITDFLAQSVLKNLELAPRIPGKR